jgi:uncharacterized membrane protein YedE/YeeE
VKALLAAFGAGLLFALGLGVAGMTQPGKIIAFLDVLGRHGAWDPSLAFVMGGALGVYALAWRLSFRRAQPWFAGSFDRPGLRSIDARLVGGAAVFGVGWGLSGYCPGPAVVSLASGGTGAMVFVAAMAAGRAASASAIES